MYTLIPPSPAARSRSLSQSQLPGASAAPATGQRSAQPWQPLADFDASASASSRSFAAAADLTRALTTRPAALTQQDDKRDRRETGDAMRWFSSATPQLRTPLLAEAFTSESPTFADLADIADRAMRAPVVGTSALSSAWPASAAGGAPMDERIRAAFEGLGSPMSSSPATALARTTQRDPRIARQSRLLAEMAEALRQRVGTTLHIEASVASQLRKADLYRHCSIADRIIDIKLLFDRVPQFRQILSDAPPGMVTLGWSSVARATLKEITRGLTPAQKLEIVSALVAHSTALPTSFRGESDGALWLKLARATFATLFPASPNAIDRRLNTENRVQWDATVNAILNTPNDSKTDACDDLRAGAFTMHIEKREATCEELPLFTHPKSPGQTWSETVAIRRSLFSCLMQPSRDELIAITARTPYPSSEPQRTHQLVLRSAVTREPGLPDYIAERYRIALLPEMKPLSESAHLLRQGSVINYCRATEGWSPSEREKLNEQARQSALITLSHRLADEQHLTLTATASCFAMWNSRGFDPGAPSYLSSALPTDATLRARELALRDKVLPMLSRLLSDTERQTFFDNHYRIATAAIPTADRAALSKVLINGVWNEYRDQYGARCHTLLQQAAGADVAASQVRAADDMLSDHLRYASFALPPQCWAALLGHLSRPGLTDDQRSGLIVRLAHHERASLTAMRFDGARDLLLGFKSALNSDQSLRATPRVAALKELYTALYAGQQTPAAAAAFTTPEFFAEQERFISSAFGPAQSLTEHDQAARAHDRQRHLERDAIIGTLRELAAQHARQPATRWWSLPGTAARKEGKHS